MHALGFESLSVALSAPTLCNRVKVIIKHRVVKNSSETIIMALKHFLGEAAEAQKMELLELLFIRKNC